jgi:hypothetical protein
MAQFSQRVPGEIATGNREWLRKQGFEVCPACTALLQPGEFFLEIPQDSGV